MNCHDAREGFSAAFHGGMGLTEWALLDAHVRQCVECRKERESVQKMMTSRQQVTRSRALLHCLGKMIDATRLRTTRLAAWLTRVGVSLAISLPVAERAVIRASRVGITWHAGLLARMRCSWTSLLSHKAARSFRRVSTGVASLAILVATIVFLWPREWPDNLKPRSSTGGQLSQEVRAPADRKPVEPAAAAQLAETQTHKSVSAPLPAPAVVSQADSRRVTIRPKPLETHAEIPAPLRTPDPALAQSQAAASPQTPTPETTWSPEPARLVESARSLDRARSENAEASDPATYREPMGPEMPGLGPDAHGAE